MNTRIAVCSHAVRLAAAVTILLLSSISAVGQDAAAPAPDGSKAQAAFNLQIDHVTLSVADLAAESNWYIEKLGFNLPAPPQKINPKMKAERLKMPGFQLDLVQYEGSGRPKAPSPIFMQQGLIHIAFSVPNLERAYAFLQAAGTDAKTNRNKEGKLGQILLHDPEGNEIEIFPR